MTYGEYELRGDRLEGDLEEDLVFTGSPSLTFRSQTLYGDVIRFNTRLKTYRIENLRTALTPEFLQNRAVSPVFLSGESVQGRDRDPILAADGVFTTCDRRRPHYHIEAALIEVDPGKRLTLRKAAISYRGRKLLVLPTVVIPLDRRFPREGYRPTVGRSVEEGWYVKTAFNYTSSLRAPGLYRVDLMERKGLGLGLEQAWDQRRFAGEAAVYGIPVGPGGSNFSAGARARMQLGGGSEVDLGYETRRNDYRTLPGTSDHAYRIALTRRAGGGETVLNYASRSNRSGTYESQSDTAALSQRFELSRSASLSLNADYSRYASGSTAVAVARQVTEQLTTRLQTDYRGPNYSLQLVANRNVPMGGGTAQSYFSGVERLPEISLSRFRFTRGYLASVPLTLSMAAGKFSEGATATGARKTVTERASFGMEFGSQRYVLSRSTELDVSFGFLQHLYGEGAAQYILRSNSSLTQRWGRKSGFALHYAYQQPHGGTPFRFDRQGKYHNMTADVGFIDDARLQLTARVGYDLALSEFAGDKQPWQTLAAHLYVRPLPWLSLRNLASYDPNQGQFLSVISDLRIRGRSDLAVDLVSRYDPRVHRFGQVNAYLNLPVLPAWRVVVLAQYNGYLERFESRNVQIIHEMHCLEASLTYIDNPYGWRADRQVLFQIRIKAFPAFQQFGTGLYGQAIDTSVGERF